MKRDRRGGRRRGSDVFGVRRRVLPTVAVMVLGAGAGMGMVWLNVQSTSATLQYEEARKENEKLLSDLNSNRLKLLNRVRLSDLDPLARERLGMTEPSVDDMFLVRFHPSLDEDGTATAGLIDRIVPQVAAGTDWTASGTARSAPTAPVKGRR